MASINGWASVAEVKMVLGATQNGSGGVTIGLTDAQIEQFINMAEGYYRVQLKAPVFSFTTATDRHYLLSACVALLAAKLLLASTPLSLATLQHWTMMNETLKDNFASFNQALLENSGKGDFVWKG